jgi:NAD(P)-dependent dehydrogenase (short-subunit alcohol dehydrogenase family)
MSNPLILVVGAGPGLGVEVARRFGAEGYDVALLARSPERLEHLAAVLTEEGVTVGWSAVDVTDEAAMSEALQRIVAHTGRLDVVHVNPSVFRHATPLQLGLDELLADVRVGVGSLLVAARTARPYLRRGGRVVATGSMAADAPWHEAASLGVQKAGLRNLVRSLDATLGPDGIRATSVTVNGTLAPGTAFAPARVAGAVYRAATRPDEVWTTEVRYDG